MTRRFFYTDPLAAAWMAKHFGVRIHADDGANDCDFRAAISDGKKLYIHSESLHLLEPQVGDLIRCGQYHDAITVEEFRGEKRISWDTYFDGGEDCRLQDLTEVKVIQRNGIPFMWPESEEV